MKIIQITDQHVGTAEEQPHGVDVRRNFQRLCRRIDVLRPDHLVITGDLCLENGDPEIYQWIKETVDQLEIPYEVLSGNHDDPCLLADVFGVTTDLKEQELYYCRTWEGECFLFLDTTPGSLSRRQLDWVEKHVRSGEGRCRILFMHHPPVIAGVPHMDSNYPLQASCREALEVIFANAMEPVRVFCGHYHHARTIEASYGTVFISPSSYVQINPYSVEFELEHTVPGFRMIELVGDKLRTSVHFLAD